jgi:hypothetical protein
MKMTGFYLKQLEKIWLYKLKNGEHYRRQGWMTKVGVDSNKLGSI